MDQAVSRPARWASASKRAADAKYELQEMRDQMISALEEFEDRWNTMRNKFEDAVLDFVSVQSEYGVWGVPDNLSDSRLQDKLNFVTSLDFNALQGIVPDFKSLVGRLKEFDPEDDNRFFVLDEAGPGDLPRGWGRD